MSDLEKALREIEDGIDDGSYRPGPWGRFLEDASAHSQAERHLLCEDVSRVSDKLHRLGAPATMDAQRALGLEVLATLAALVLLALGLRAESVGSIAVATTILAVTLQPLLKTAAGAALGIRYSYAYLWKIEPRFKMEYGTYLSAARWQRATLHAAGCFGTPFALWLVATLASGRLDDVARVCEILFTVLLAAQLALFVLAFVGFSRLGPLGLLRLTSAGGAAHELARSHP
jgi:hypothetical protein